MFRRPLFLWLCVLTFTLVPPGARADNAADVAAWDSVLASVPADAKTIALGDQIVPITTAYGWRNQLAAQGGGFHTNLASQGGVALWPGGNVYYMFNANVSANHRRQFTDAIKEWETAANVHFIVRTNQSNYVSVNDGGKGLGGGNSAVGMIGGPQDLNIGTTSWVRPTILHEVGHTLGLVHEHQRSDRDPFITIAAAYVNDGNFVKIPNSVNRTAYDFLSVMHYARNAFTSDGSDVIICNAGYTQFAPLMGAQFNPVFSRSDRQGMVQMYGAGPAPSLVVTNVQDSGPGSLRAAITAAEDQATDNPGTHPPISFQLPAALRGANPYFTIALSWPLQPVLNTTVDGATQTSFGGNSNTAGPEILLTGEPSDSTDQGYPAFSLANSFCLVSGFAINGCSATCVEMTGPNCTGNTIAGCYIGTNPAGTAAVPSVYEGIRIHGQAHGNVVGGATVAARNLISGNALQGVLLDEAGTTANRVIGNWIGLNAAGTAALPNLRSGVFIFNSAGGNFVGGSNPGEGNVLSGNTDDGATIDGPAVANAILGNLIGTNPAGLAAIANGDCGIVVFGGATNSVIGGTVAGARNVISGNFYEGIFLNEHGTNGNKVLGNYIGVNINGNLAIPNGPTTNSSGLFIGGGAQQNVVGGTIPAARNILSGNTSYGVGMSDTGTSFNSIIGNYIGLDPSGSNVVANGFGGVIIYSSASANFIGWASPGAGNVVSGNGGAGIWFSAANGNYAYSNYVGLDAAGLVSKPNAFDGMLLNSTASSNIIGAGSGGRNYISGNTGKGINLQGNFNIIKGNTIGRNVAGSVVGNTSDGIDLYGLRNQVGGANPGDANLISGNGNRGVLVYTGANASAGNTISGNSIYGNTAAAIDLVGGSTINSAGLNTNDAGDADTGANNRQNYPTVTAATVFSSTSITGTFNSTPSSNFRLEFFSSPAGGPAGVGEARYYLGGKVVTTNSSGNLNFVIALPQPVTPGNLITATATNVNTGDTSELAPGVATTTTDTDHDGLPDSWETANGFTIGPDDGSPDLDGDGLSNLTEFYAGTNPRDRTSTLGIAKNEVIGSDRRITLATAAGRNFRIEYTDTVSNPASWRTFADQVLGIGGLLQLTDPGAAPQTTRAYRVLLQR